MGDVTCRMTAWSPLRSIQSLSKFFFISGAATVTAWYAHPHLLNLAAHVLNLDFKDNVTAFQTSFFSFLSLVFAIYSGNTMAFLYDVRPSYDYASTFLRCCSFHLIPNDDVIIMLWCAFMQRQKEVVKNLYAECMALEELLEESVNTLGPDARDILAQVRWERFPEGILKELLKMKWVSLLSRSCSWRGIDVELRCAGCILIRRCTSQRISPPLSGRGMRWPPFVPRRATTAALALTLERFCKLHRDWRMHRWVPLFCYLHPEVLLLLAMFIARGVHSIFGQHKAMS